MIKKIAPIKNPLTIIAIFAGLAETSGTVVLPFVEKTIQLSFVWFLIIFPTLLIILFFLTLNFNHRVLYAPSDYQDEENFMKPFVKSTNQDRITKINEEIDTSDKNVKSEEPDKDNYILYQKNKDNIQEDSQLYIYKSIINNNIQATHLLAEELVLTKLEMEFKNKINRELTFKSGANRYKFDGIIEVDNDMYIIEVKYIGTKKNVRVYLSNTLKRMQEIHLTLESEFKKEFKLILAVVTNFDKDINNQLKSRIFSLTSKMNYFIDIRMYNFDELKEEFDINKT